MLAGEEGEKKAVFRLIRLEKGGAGETNILGDIGVQEQFQHVLYTVIAVDIERRRLVVIDMAVHVVASHAQLLDIKMIGMGMGDKQVAY